MGNNLWDSLHSDFSEEADKWSELDSTTPPDAHSDIPVEQPTDSTEQPTDSTEQPTDSTEQPTDSTEQPTDSTEQPTDSTEQDDLITFQDDVKDLINNAKSEDKLSSYAGQVAAGARQAITLPVAKVLQDTAEKLGVSTNHKVDKHIKQVSSYIDKYNSKHPDEPIHPATAGAIAADILAMPGLKGASFLGKVAKGGASGAIIGALNNLGKSGNYEDAAVGGVVGGAVGGVVGGIGEVIGRAAMKQINRISASLGHPLSFGAQRMIAINPRIDAFKAAKALAGVPKKDQEFVLANAFGYDYPEFIKKSVYYDNAARGKLNSLLTEGKDKVSNIIGNVDEQVARAKDMYSEMVDKVAERYPNEVKLNAATLNKISKLEEYNKVFNPNNEEKIAAVQEIKQALDKGTINSAEGMAVRDKLKSLEESATNQVEKNRVKAIRDDIDNFLSKSVGSKNLEDIDNGVSKIADSVDSLLVRYDGVVGRARAIVNNMKADISKNNGVLNVQNALQWRKDLNYLLSKAKRFGEKRDIINIKNTIDDFLKKNVDEGTMTQINNGIANYARAMNNKDFRDLLEKHTKKDITDWGALSADLKKENLSSPEVDRAIEVVKTLSRRFKNNRELSKVTSFAGANEESGGLLSTQSYLVAAFKDFFTMYGNRYDALKIQNAIKNSIMRSKSLDDIYKNVDTELTPSMASDFVHILKSILKIKSPKSDGIGVVPGATVGAAAQATSEETQQ